MVVPGGERTRLRTERGLRHPGGQAWPAAVPFSLPGALKKWNYLQPLHIGRFKARTQNVASLGNGRACRPGHHADRASPAEREAGATSGSRSGLGPHPRCPGRAP